MRVAIVTESFLPQVNGVTNTVRQVLDRLLATGHQAMVVAPGPGPDDYRGVLVLRVRSVALPGYRSFPVGLPDPAVERTLADFAPDVVHLASPVALGVVGLRAARRLGVPTVAVYQTDLAGFARQYGVRADAAVGRWVGRIHRRADRTLVPSTASYAQLRALGVQDLHLWRRGVALELFSAAHRDPDLRSRWTGHHARTVVGYVGRLAAEKQVHRLATLSRIPEVQLVVVGDGPARPALERQLPGAVFTGMLHGADLARAYATLDVFVHTGEAETFCQTIQEAQASGVPVVAPASGGPLDLVAPGRTGLLYPPGDDAGLRRAVAELVHQPDVRSTLAARALSDVRQRSWASVVDQLVDVHYRAVAHADHQLVA